MANSDEEIRISVREALQDIAQLKGGLADLRGEMGKTKAAGQSAFGGESAIKEGQAVDALRKKYAEIKQAADTLRTALKNAYDPRVIKTYSDALAKADVAQKKIETGAKAAGVSLKNIGKEGSLAANIVSEAFGKIGKATVILAILDGVYQLSKAGLELSNNYNKAKVQFEAFLGSSEKADQVLGQLTDFSFSKFLNTQDVLDAGKSLLAFGESADNLVPVLGRIADISAGTGKNFSELTTIYGKARTAGVLYAEDINQLIDAGIPIIGEFAKQMGVTTGEVKKLASEGKISFEELQLAFFNLTKEGGKFSDLAEAQATTLPGMYEALKNRLKPALQAIGGFFTQLGKDVVNLANDILDAVGVQDKAAAESEKITGATIARLKKQRDAIAIQLTINPSVQLKADYEAANAALEAALKDPGYLEALKDSNEQEQKIIDEANAARNRKSADQAKKDKAAQEKRLKDQEEYNKRLVELSLQRLAPESEELAVAKEKVRFAAQKKEFEKFGLDTEAIELIHQANLFDIRLEFDNKRNKQAQESAKRLADIYDKANKDYEDGQKKQLDAATKEIDFQRDLANQRIDVQEEINKGIIISLEKSGAKEADVKEAQRQFDLQIQKARLEAELKFQTAMLDLLNQQGGDNTKQADSILATIDKIKAAIANVTADTAANPGSGKKKTLAEQLGLSKDDVDALDQAKDAVISVLEEISQARVDAADKELELAQKKTEAAQAEFDKQKELDASGYANSLDTATLRLAAAKDEEDKALKIKQDAQRKQVQLDSAIQLSSLLTSSANIFKSLSGLGPIGVAAAVVTIAAMFAAFAAARSRAAQAVKFRQGGEIGPDGVMRGPSHENGGVGFEMEGGEFLHTDGRRLAIVNKRSTRAEFDLLAAINKNDEGAKTRWALNRVATMNRDGINSAIGEGRGSVTVINKEDRKAHSLLKQIRDKKNQTSETWIENGYRVTKKGGRTERVKI